MANLKEGDVFSTNNYGDSTVLRFGMPQPDSLCVMCSISIGFKTHAFTKITFKDSIFIMRIWASLILAMNQKKSLSQY